MSTKNIGKTNNSLCWSCQNCTGGCSWSFEFLPVKGWLATATKLQVTPKTTLDSYYVHKCPLYLADNRKEITLEYISNIIAKKLCKTPIQVYRQLTSKTDKLFNELAKPQNKPLLDLYNNYIIDKQI